MQMVHQHMDAMHPPTIKCTNCKEDRFFRTIQSLTNHFLKFHPKPVKAPKVPNRVQCPDEPVRPEKPKKPEKPEKPEKPKKPKRRKREPVACSACPEIFSCKSKLIVHLQSVHSHKWYNCKVCGKEFAGYPGYRNHILTVHVEESPYVCGTCGMAFKTQYRLQTHEKQHGPKNFPCDLCLKKYATKTALWKHKDRAHMPRVYVQCEICGKTIRKQALHSHKRSSHRPDTAERKHECTLCGKKFYISTGLRIHMLRHYNIRQFACDLCGKTFVTKTTLKTHIMFHINKRRFKCETCGKKFVTGGSLNKHKFTHFEKKQFQCEVCERWYTTDHSRVRHMKTFHQNV